MLYEKSITIPITATQANPEVEILRIAHGVITKIMVRPRPGHAGLAHCVIRHHEHQIAPSTENMTLHGDTFPIDWEESLEIDQPPYELKIVGWNEDDTYEHAFDIFVAMLPAEQTLAAKITKAISNLFSIFSPRRIFGGGA